MFLSSAARITTSLNTSNTPKLSITTKLFILPSHSPALHYAPPPSLGWKLSPASEHVLERASDRVLARVSGCCRQCLRCSIASTAHPTRCPPPRERHSSATPTPTTPLLRAHTPTLWVAFLSCPCPRPHVTRPYFPACGPPSTTWMRITGSQAAALPCERAKLPSLHSDGVRKS